MPGNLYTFGCSFARYSWPMWPEILAQSYNTTKNYGHPGCGNFYIFQKASDALINNRIKSTDTVIVQWTEPSRTDYITDGDWFGAGSLTAELLIKSNLDVIISDETSILKTLTYMSNLIHLLENVGCNWYFMFMTPDSMVHLNKHLDLFLNTGLYNSYNSLLKNILSYETRFVDSVSMTSFYNSRNMPIKKCFYLNYKNKTEKYHDDHPLPYYTLMYIKEVASLSIPNLNILEMERYVFEVMKNFDDYKNVDLDKLKQKLEQDTSLLFFKNTIDGRYTDE